MEFADNELARLDQNTVRLREGPVRARWVLDGLTTQDHHRLRMVFTASVKPLLAEAERAMLREVFLASGQSLHVAQVVEHFLPAMQAAAATLAGHSSVESALDPANHSPIVQALADAARKTAFACGLDILPPFSLVAESTTYAQARLLEMQRNLAEHHSAGQLAHLERAGELLSRFESLRHQMPGLSAEGVLGRLAPVDRGPMLQTLLMAAASQQGRQTLHVASGSELLVVDTRVKPVTFTPVPMESDLGPLRSVQSAEGSLLVGARGGVLAIDADAPANHQVYPFNSDSPMGFNSVAQAGERVLACHADAGVVIWNAPGEPSRILSCDALRKIADVPGDSNGPRYCTPVNDGAVLVAIAHRLLLIDGETTQPLAQASTADIVGIVPDDDQLIVVHEDGLVCTFGRITRELRPGERRTSHALAAASLPWLGGNRLLVAHDDGQIDCIGLQDGLVTQFHAPYRGIRMIAATADQVAAVSADRQRITIWNSWNNERPVDEIHITSLTKHRIADISFE